MSYLNYVKIYPDGGISSSQHNSNLDPVNLTVLNIGVYDLSHMGESENTLSEWKRLDKEGSS